MAKRKARGGGKRARPAAGKAGTRTRTARKPARRATAAAKRKAAKPSRSKRASAKPARRAAAKTRRRAAGRGLKKAAGAGKRPRSTVTRQAARPAAGLASSPRLDRTRRTLVDSVPTPPSSLDMNRHASAARTGRAETAERRQDHRSLTPDIAGGDLDVNVENAYFSGDEVAGGDNPTPDQDIVDNIGRAVGVQYDDNEELRASDKVVERDKHRWELDPASSEDYKERK